MFPFTFTYSSNLNTQLTDSEQQKALNYLSSYIANLNGKDIIIGRDRLSFRSSFFAFNWDTFAQIDSGEFILTDNVLKFKVSLFRKFIMLVALTVFFILTSKQTYLGVFFFMFFFLANWLTAFGKFKKLTYEVSLKLNSFKTP
jgi:hypothetical protein